MKNLKYRRLIYFITLFTVSNVNFAQSKFGLSGNTPIGPYQEIFSGSSQVDINLSNASFYPEQSATPWKKQISIDASRSGGLSNGNTFIVEESINFLTADGAISSYELTGWQMELEFMTGDNNSFQFNSAGFSLFSGVSNSSVDVTNNILTFSFDPVTINADNKKGLFINVPIIYSGDTKSSGNQTFHINQFAIIDSSAIPEPSIIHLFIIGSILLICFEVRKKLSK